MPIFFWIGFWLLGLLPVFQHPIKSGGNSGWALEFAKKYPETGLEPRMPTFFGLVSGYWVCYQFFSLPLLLGQIRAGLWNLPKVPGARPGGQNAHFFWFGFWLLGLLPVFQPPIKAGANSGWALKFAKVPGARPGGQNAPRTPGAPGAPWLPGAPRTPWSQDTNSPQDTRSPKKHPGPQYPRLLVCLPGFQPPTKVGTNLGGVVRFTKKYPKPALERRTLPFFRWASGHSCPTRFPVPQHNGSKFGLFF